MSSSSSASQRSADVVPLSPAAAALPAAVIGWVVAVDPERGPLVDFPGNPHGPVPARLLLAVEPAALVAAAAARQPAALLFERGDASLPLIAGLVQPLRPTEEPARELRVDGKRVEIRGEDEIELRCGDASISLKKDGKLVIRGAYVETRARGTNRIKGGSVQIN